MDLVFAVDSVPAVLAITRDTFLAYSSNIFAILGLRAIYFVLADLLRQIRFLHQGLAAVLVFVGGKMVAADYLAISAGTSLAIVAAIFALTLLISYFAGLPAKA
jgi:tellurite resistance protein TerC